MKLSIVGTGKIVGEVMEMLHRDFAGQIEVTGIYAREKSVARAKELMEVFFPSGAVYTDYGRMLQEAEADFVYIANANHVHYAYAMQAIRAGRSVIVEKPLTVTGEETKLLFDTAQQNGVLCLPAFSLLYMPLFAQLAQAVEKIGAVRIVECNYSQYSSRYDRYLKGEITPVFDPSCAGGALMDINIYNLCFCIALFGLPCSVRYEANRGFNGIDTSGTLMLRYPSFVASLTGAKDSAGASHGCIQGEKGFISVDGSVSVLNSFTLHLNGQEPQTFFSEERHRLGFEFEAFRQLADCRAESRLDISFLSRVAKEVAKAVDESLGR